jgi:hypothetical protein
MHFFITNHDWPFLHWIILIAATMIGIVRGNATVARHRPTTRAVGAMNALAPGPTPVSTRP